MMSEVLNQIILMIVQGKKTLLMIFSIFIQLISKAKVKLTFSSLHKGMNKGLTVVLDLHGDLAAANSIDVDEQGFIATLTSNRSFPMTAIGGFLIKPGHTNLVIFKIFTSQLLSQKEFYFARRF